MFVCANFVPAFDTNQAGVVAQQFSNQNLTASAVQTGSNWFGLSLDLANISPYAVIVLVLEIIVISFLLQFISKSDSFLWWIVSIIIVCAFVFPATAGVIFGLV